MAMTEEKGDDTKEPASSLDVEGKIEGGNPSRQQDNRFYAGGLRSKWRVRKLLRFF